MDTFDWNKLRQLNNWEILLAFIAPSSFAFIGFRFVLPWLVDHGYPKVLMWGIIASLMLFVLVVLGLVLNYADAKANKISLKKRLLLKNISGKEWFIYIGIMLGGVALSSALSPLVTYFAQIPGLAIPDYMPFWLDPSVNPMEADIEDLSPGYILKGNITVVAIMSVCILLNILAEEIYFRAWLLPKMAKLGKWSWVVNGVAFALYHTYQLWLFPMMVVISLATTFTVYKSKSILPAFAIHFVANFLIGIAGILMLVFG